MGLFKKIGKSLKKAAKKTVGKAVKKTYNKVKKTAKKAAKTAKKVGKVAKKVGEIAETATNFDKLGKLAAKGVCSGPLKGKTCNSIVSSTVRIGGSLADFAAGGQITAANQSINAAQKLLKGDLKGLAKQGLDFAKDAALEKLSGGLSEHLDTIKDVTGKDPSELVKTVGSVVDMANQADGFIDDPFNTIVKQAMSSADIIEQNVGVNPRNIIRTLQDQLPVSYVQNLSGEELLQSAQGQLLLAMTKQTGDSSTPGFMDVNENRKYLSSIEDYTTGNILEQFADRTVGETPASIAQAYRQFPGHYALTSPLQGFRGNFSNPFGGFRGFHGQRSYGVLPPQLPTNEQFGAGQFRAEQFGFVPQPTTPFGTTGYGY